MSYKHGGKGTRLYSIWKGIRKRCSSTASGRDYSAYYSQGIRVCIEWQEFPPFKEWAEASGYRDDLTIDRIDNGLGYFPDNCRWATYAEQNRNRRSNLWLEVGGVRKVLTDWAQDTGLDRSNVKKRLNKGWSPAQALGFEKHPDARRLCNRPST